MRYLLQACIKYLLMSDSRNHMLDRFKKEFEGIWPRWEYFHISKWEYFHILMWEYLYIENGFSLHAVSPPPLMLTTHRQYSHCYQQHNISQIIVFFDIVKKTTIHCITVKF